MKYTSDNHSDKLLWPLHFNPVLIITLILMACVVRNSFAHSIASKPKNIPMGVPKIHPQSVNTGVTFHPFPTPEFVQRTGILFFYSQKVLHETYEGDPAKLYDFLEKSIEVNNTMFSQSGIGIERVMVGLRPLPDNFSEDEMFKRVVPIRYIGQLLTGSKSASIITLENEMDDMFVAYGASYYVALTFPQVTEETPDPKWIGQAVLTGKTSIVTPYYNLDSSVATLTHELGHNDGLNHSTQSPNLDRLLREDAVGYKCGYYQSVMSVSGPVGNTYFYSDPLTTVKDTNEACGEEGAANIASVYRDVIQGGEIYPSEGSLSNWVPVNAVQGAATLDVSDVEVEETEGEWQGQVQWSGLSPDDHGSFELVVDFEQSTIDRDDIGGDGIISVRYNGEPSTTIAIPLIDDEIVEGDESIVLRVHTLNGVTLSDGIDTVTVTLTSDETAPVGDFGFEQSSLSVTESGTVSLVINRTGGDTGQVTVNLDVTGGNVSDSDYTLSSQSVVFENGQTQKTVALNAARDDIEESAETVEISLRSQGIVFTQRTVTVTINNRAQTPITVQSQSSESGGGSMGFILTPFVALLALWRRKAKRCDKCSFI